jgi:hypothetical protein
MENSAKQLEELPQNPRINYTVHAIKFGVIIAIGLMIIDLVSVLLMEIDIKPKGLLILMILFIFATVFFSVKGYRDQINNGFLTIGQSVGIGFKMALSGGLIYAVYSLIKVYFFVDMVQITEDAMFEKMEESGRELTEEQIAMSMKMATMFTNPFILSILSYLFSIFWCTVMGLFTGIFIKKE